MSEEGTERRMTNSGEVEADRLYTRREWLVRQAILGGSSPNMAIEAVSSVAMEHDWDMDEQKTMAQWKSSQ